MYLRVHIRAKKRSRYGVAEWRREESIEEEGGDGVKGVSGVDVSVDCVAFGGPPADVAHFFQGDADGTGHAAEGMSQSVAVVTRSGDVEVAHEVLHEEVELVVRQRWGVFGKAEKCTAGKRRAAQGEELLQQMEYGCVVFGAGINDGAFWPAGITGSPAFLSVDVDADGFTRTTHMLTQDGSISMGAETKTDADDDSCCCLNDSAVVRGEPVQRTLAVAPLRRRTGTKGWRGGP